MNAGDSSPTAVVKVAVDRPLRSLLDYLPPAGMQVTDLPVGTRVRVPMGTRSAVGIIVAHAAQSPLAPGRLRPVAELLDAEPMFEAALLELLQWTASYYHHPAGEVLAAALPAALRAGQPFTAQEQWLQLTSAGRDAGATGELQRAPRQRELLEILAAHEAGLSVAQLSATTAAGWRSAARALGERGFIRFVLREQRPAAATGRVSGTSAAAPELSNAQTLAVAAIDACAGRYGAFLLQGATGSGKTEVYLRLVMRALERGVGRAGAGAGDRPHTPAARALPLAPRGPHRRAAFRA